MNTTAPTSTRIGKFTWNGKTWHAAEFDGALHLTRICRGCWSTAPGYVGMWNPRRHTEEMAVPLDVVANRDAAVLRLREAGENEIADELAAKAGRWL
jgi:hypothetical protein